MSSTDETAATTITPLLNTTQLVDEQGPNRHVVSINEIDPRLALTLNDTSVSTFYSLHFPYPLAYQWFAYLSFSFFFSSMSFHVGLSTQSRSS